MNECERARFWGDIVKNGKEQRVLLKLRCGQWSCPFCAKQNADSLRRILSEALESYLAENDMTQPKMRYGVKLVTLTLPGSEWRKLYTVFESDKIIKKSLDSLIRRLRKKFGLRDYVWVRELQPSGYPHIHLLILGPEISGKGILDFIRQAWSVDMGMGNVDIQLVRTPRGVANYLVKYLTKGRAEGANGYRIWTMSKDMRDRARKIKSDISAEVTIIRLGVLNFDGSYGRVVWEREGWIDWEGQQEKENLKKLLDFFDCVKYDLYQQVKLF